MASKTEIIDGILQKFIDNGCSPKTVTEIRPTLLEIVENFKDQTPSESIEEIIVNLEEATKNFLNEKNDKGISLIYGIASSVYAYGKNDEDWTLLFHGGKTNYDTEQEVTEHTKFDVASITKLYTLVLKDKLVESGYFKDSDKIVDLLPEFINMEDFTLEDLSLLCGELRTNGRLDSAPNRIKALEMLKEIYLHSNDRTVNKYSDFGAIITALAIESRFNALNDTTYDFAKIMQEIIFNKCSMSSTIFNPSEKDIVSGNGSLDNIVHDPKTRILGGISGAAGLFTTTLDQAKFAKALFAGNNPDYDFINDPVSPENIKKYGTVTFPNSPQSNKGHFGLYVKNPDPAKFFCPQDYSNGTFVHQGWTGAYTVFDPTNEVHNSIFVGALRPDLVKQYKEQEDFKEYISNDKPTAFMSGFHTYQDAITKNTLIIKALKEYLSMCYEESEMLIRVKVR